MEEAWNILTRWNGSKSLVGVLYEGAGVTGWFNGFLELDGDKVEVRWSTGRFSLSLVGASFTVLHNPQDPDTETVIEFSEFLMLTAIVINLSSYETCTIFEWVEDSRSIN